MKSIINNIVNWRAVTSALIILSSLLIISCNGKDEQMKWVDLRYKANDSYTIAASGEEKVTIQVKSTDPWEVYAKHADWSSISPDKGGAGETYDVTITYKANTHLDDRTDTITIKSDYWVGKEVQVIQKGTAFLTLQDTANIVLGKDEGSAKSFMVSSNQKWSAAVTEGGDWLSVSSGASGEGNGTVTAAAKANIGEKRYGKITVYDRHGAIHAEVNFTQDGVQLDPDETSIRVLHENQEYTIPVISNTTWTVSKDDENAEWYSFNKTEFNGNESLVIKVDENNGTAVRKATFTISTTVVPGITPVTRTITLKQANEPIAVRHAFAASEWTVNRATISFAGDVLTSAAGRVTKDGFAPGYYSFRIKSMTPDAFSIIFFTYGDKEVRWHLDMENGRTGFSTTPWGPLNEQNIAFDKSLKEYTLGLNLTKSSQDGLAKVEWYLNGVLIKTYDNDQAAKIPYANAFVYLGSNKGTVVYDWWEYTPPIDWGND